MLKLKERISEIIRREVEDFRKDFKISENYSFNQYQTIRRINNYINDKFYTRTEPDLIFWNLSTPRIIHFAKNIDLDTKDLLPVGKGDTNFLQAWILRLRFQKWMKDNKLSLTLNDLSEGIATYGSIVWKTYDDYETKEKCLVESDLRHLYFNPAAKTIRKTPVVELHYLSEIDIREKEGAWDNIDDILKNARKADGSDKENKENRYMLREIWERWGECVDLNGKVHYCHYIGAGYGDKETIAFYDEDIDCEELPYYDFHIGRYRGRWMRVGVVERLFKVQERANAVVNANAEATQIASLLLMRTNEPNTTGNVLEGAISGQIINSADLQQIGIDNRAFTVLLGELDRLERQADKLCLTPEVITGDAMPSGTPFRAVAAMSNSAKSAFQYIKQTIGETVSFLLEEEILPSVVKKWNRGSVLDIIDNLKDINLYDDQIVQIKLLEYIKTANERGKYVSDEEIANVEQEYRANIEKTGRTIDIPKGFFNFEFGISLNVTGETVDKSAKNDAYSNILQWKQGNPAVVNDPYFRQYCEDNQITPIRMSEKEIQQQAQGLQSTQKKPNMAPPQTGGLASLINQ
ncbi:MAG: hypothetical protein WCN88_04760 [Candidatus Falkowbacteria bacterium]